MVFVELPLFAKYIAFTDDELRTLQLTLLQRPETGDVIAHGCGLRKVRVKLPGRGKRGGARVIYYWMTSSARCYLILAYPKNMMDDLTDKQLAELVKTMKKEITHE